MKLTRKNLFILAIVFQVFILIGMLVKANLPLWFGKEVKVYTKPIDPRSLLRGNYVKLSYYFDDFILKENDSQTRLDLRVDTKVYILLNKNKNNIYVMKEMSLKKPSKGVFLQGRLKSHYRNFKVEVANINAFFTQKEKALKLEKGMRGKSSIAILMVDNNGKAMIKDVVTIK